MTHVRENDASSNGTLNKKLGAPVLAITLITYVLLTVSYDT